MSIDHQQTEAGSYKSSTKSLSTYSRDH